MCQAISRWVCNVYNLWWKSCRETSWMHAAAVSVGLGTCSGHHGGAQEVNLTFVQLTRESSYFGLLEDSEQGEREGPRWGVTPQGAIWGMVPCGGQPVGNGLGTWVFSAISESLGSLEGMLGCMLKAPSLQDSTSAGCLYASSPPPHKGKWQKAAFLI